MRLDVERFPRTAKYLSGLPAGLNSYPECTVISDARSIIGEEFPELRQETGLPEVIGQCLKGVSQDKWISEVAGNAILLLVRDRCVDSDELYIQWCREKIRRLYDKPLFRAMMFVFSTTLVVMGGSKRWSTFHKGTYTTMSPVRKYGDLFTSTTTIHHPKDLFCDDLLVGHLRESFVVALEAARAKNLKVETSIRNPESTVFKGSWGSELA